MVNEEILGGLRSSLERGESMKKAIATFLNAGYDKDEISEAAATLANQPIPQKPTQPPVPGQPQQFTQLQTGPMEKGRLDFLKQTMLILANAGYNLQEIETAAMALEGANTSPTLKPIKTAPVAQTIPGTAPPAPPTLSQTIQPAQKNEKEKTIQNASKYGGKKSNKIGLIIIFGAIVFVLLCGLITTFIFKDQLINLFNTLF